MKVNGGRVGDEVVSRPASSPERPGSRVASGAAPRGVCTAPSRPTSHLDARTNDNTNPPVSTSDLNDDHFKEDEHRTRESTALCESADGDDKAVDIEDMDRELQEAMDETSRLDAVLAVLQLKVKLLKFQGKELRKQLWEELMSVPKSFEYPGEAENTRLFLALEAPLELEVEADFEPLFETQPPDENELNIGHKEEQSQNNVRRLTKSCEEDQEEKGQEPPHLSHSDAAQGKKQQDFVKKNIELAGATGDLLVMTPAEKDRLAELLRDIDEEFGQEDGHTAGERGDSEGDAWAVSLRPGEGFTPDAAQLELLRYIDFRLNLLSSAEDSSSVQSSLDGSMSRGPGSDAGWELGEDAWTGGGGDAGYETEEGPADLACPRDAAAAQDAGPVSQEMASLGEEQLRDLLDECELSQIGRPEPPPSEAVLAALLRDPYTTSLAQLGPDARDP
ncbi:hypothetical protein CRUP_013390 [Coryphaenoides rupestris]|nr:hypothetical protein CRUP_013390 [Coryphaenoides rupestris]